MTLQRLFAVAILVWAVFGPDFVHAASLPQAMASFGVQQPQVRKSAPDFALAGLNGKQVSLADLRGQLVLLHFWATWCVPCRHEMPLLHDLERQLAGTALRIICINVNRGDKQTVQSFMDEVSPNFRTLLDAQGNVRNRYEVRALPTSYLIAPDGRFIGRMIGERDWNSAASVRMLRQMLEYYQKNGEEP